MRRGEIHVLEIPGKGRRPAAIVTRGELALLLSSVTVALITRTVRRVSTEVPVGPENGLDAAGVINALDLYTVPRSCFLTHVGSIDPEQSFRLDVALRIALGLE